MTSSLPTTRRSIEVQSSEHYLLLLSGLQPQRPIETPPHTIFLFSFSLQPILLVQLLPRAQGYPVIHLRGYLVGPVDKILTTEPHPTAHCSKVFYRNTFILSPRHRVLDLVLLGNREREKEGTKKRSLGCARDYLYATDRQGCPQNCHCPSSFCARHPITARTKLFSFSYLLPASHHPRNALTSHNSPNLPPSQSAASRPGLLPIEDTHWIFRRSHRLPPSRSPLLPMRETATVD